MMIMTIQGGPWSYQRSDHHHHHHLHEDYHEDDHDHDEDFDEDDHDEDFDDDGHDHEEVIMAIRGGLWLLAIWQERIYFAVINLLGFNEQTCFIRTTTFYNSQKSILHWATQPLMRQWAIGQLAR